MMASFSVGPDDIRSDNGSRLKQDRVPTRKENRYPDFLFQLYGQNRYRASLLYYRADNPDFLPRALAC